MLNEMNICYKARKKKEKKRKKKNNKSKSKCSHQSKLSETEGGEPT